MFLHLRHPLPQQKPFHPAPSNAAAPQMQLVCNWVKPHLWTSSTNAAGSRRNSVNLHFRVLALELFPNALDHNVAQSEMQPTSNWKSLILRPPGRQGRTLRACRLDPLRTSRSPLRTSAVPFWDIPDSCPTKARVLVYLSFIVRSKDLTLRFSHKSNHPLSHVVKRGNGSSHF